VSSKERVLVTGGAGFIGSNIVDALLDRGHEVAVVDDLSHGRVANLAAAGAAAELFEMDIRSEDLGRVFRSFRPSIVMHLAAQIDVRVSVRDPRLDADINIMGTLNILEHARDGVRKVLVASSGGCVYGEAKRLPIKESARGRPASPYGISKRVLHDYLAFYRSVYALEHTVLALSNVFGPRQDPHGEAGVVAIFLRSMLEGGEQLIFGDGSQTRDFVYVGDVADAFVRAISDGDGVYNIGTGRQTSVSELWRACASVTGYRGEPRHEAPRAGELQANALDAVRARRDLGWMPTVSLEEGLGATAAFIEQLLATGVAING